MNPRSPTDMLTRDFEISRGLAHLFEMAMRDGRTPPLEALEMLARALGSVYRDVARAHTDPSGCQCGWKPDESDLRALSEALQKAMRPEPRVLPNLESMEPAGRA